MAYEVDDDQSFGAQVDALEGSLGDASAVAASFGNELRRMRSDMSQTSSSVG